MISANFELSLNEKKVILINCFWAAAAAFGSYTVANWTISLSGDISALVLQFSMQILPHLIFYYLTLNILHKVKISTVFSISFIIFMLAFTVFFVFVKLSQFLIANLGYGILAGIGNGLYWSCINNINSGFTTKKSRPFYISSNVSKVATFSFSAPFLMTVIVLFFQGKTGIPDIVYTIFYSLTVIFLIIAAVLAKSIKIGCYPSKMILRDGLSFKDKKWKKLLVFSLIFGMISGATGAIGSVYLITFSSFPAATYLFFLCVSIIFNIIVAKRFSSPFFQKNRKKIYYFAISLEALTYLLIVIFYNYPQIVCLAVICLIGRGISQTIRGQTENMLVMNIIADYVKEQRDHSSRYCAREIFVMLGRIFDGIIFLVLNLIFPEKIFMLLVVILCFFVLNLFSLIIFRTF